MRKKIIAGNWKMNLSPAEGIQLVEELKKHKLETDAQLVIFPPYVHLPSIAQALLNSTIEMGAQTCHHQSSGAYTGEVSAEMLAQVGAKWVILGHSERRFYQNEDSLLISLKINAALENNLTPIYCVGETLEQRLENTHFEILKNQIMEGLFHLNEVEISRCVIAYEPVWAIGTGETATPSQAQEVHDFIRTTIAENYGVFISENISILYGGSVKPDNALELFSCPDIDGGLIGGAALKAQDFVQIAKAML